MLSPARAHALPIELPAWEHPLASAVPSWGSEAVLSPCTHGRMAPSRVSSAGAACTLGVWQRGLPGAALASPGAAVPARMLRPGQAGSASRGGAVPAWPSCISRSRGWVLLCQQKSAFLGLIILLCNKRLGEKHRFPVPSCTPAGRAVPGELVPPHAPAALAPTLPVSARVPPEVTSVGEHVLAQTLARHLYFCAEWQRCRVTYLGCSAAPSQPRYLGDVYCIC